MAAQGDLRVVVTSDSSQFRRDLAQNRNEVHQLGRDFARAGSGGAGSNRLLELGRLAEDAAVGYQLDGLSMALRSSANNVTQLATTISPLAGGLAGLGVAALSVAPALIGIGTGAESSAGKIETLTDAMKKLSAENDAAARRGDVTAQFDAKGKGIRGADAGRLMDMRGGLVDAAKEVDIAQFRDRNRLRNMIPRELDAQVKAFTDRPSVAMGEWLMDQIKNTPIRNVRGELMPGMGADQLSAVSSVVSNMVDAQSQQVNITEQIAKIEKELPVAQRRQEDEAKRGVLAAAAARRDAIFGEEQRMRLANENPSERLGREMTNVRALQLGAEREGIKLDQNVVARQQIASLKDFAKSTGLLTPAGRLEGATKGSREDFSARIAASSKDPAVLLEKQLAEMQKNGATDQEILALMRQLVKQSDQPEVVVEF